MPTCTTSLPKDMNPRRVLNTYASRNSDKKNMYKRVESIVFKHVLCGFMYVFRLNVNLLQIKIQRSKTNHYRYTAVGNCRLCF